MELMWQGSASIFYSIARGAGGIFEAANLCLSVLIAALIFTVEVYRFGARIIAASMAVRHRIGAGTGEDGQS